MNWHNLTYRYPDLWIDLCPWRLHAPTSVLQDRMMSHRKPIEKKSPTCYKKKQMKNMSNSITNTTLGMGYGKTLKTSGPKWPSFGKKKLLKIFFFSAQEPRQSLLFFLLFEPISVLLTISATISVNKTKYSFYGIVSTI